MRTIIVKSLIAAVTAAFLIPAFNAYSQNLTTEFEQAGYTLVDLGSIDQLPAQYGGLTIRPGEPNTLYIGGDANFGAGALYTVPLQRDPVTQEITGFAGSASLYVNTPNIDGGVYFAPNGTLLFTRYSMNELGQILPDDSYVSVPLGTYGIASSVGSLAIVPFGFPGAGNLVLSSYNGSAMYNVPYTIDGTGQYMLSNQNAEVSVDGTATGPEGIAYIPIGSLAFPSPSMAISSYSRGTVVVFEVGDNGLPLINTARDMVVGLTGAEGALIDPVTGDFLFSTFGGGNKVIRISGFEPPSSIGEVDDPGNLIFKLHPNPTAGKVTLSLEGHPDDFSYRVINVAGKEIIRGSVSGKRVHGLDLSEYPDGIYLVEVGTANGKNTQRIIKRQ